MLKSELGHSVLMRRKEKAVPQSWASASLIHKEPRKGWQGVGKLSTGLQWGGLLGRGLAGSIQRQGSLTVQLHCGSENQNHMWPSPRRHLRFASFFLACLTPISSHHSPPLTKDFRAVSLGSHSKHVKWFWNSLKTLRVLRVHKRFEISYKHLVFLAIPPKRGASHCSLEPTSQEACAVDSTVHPLVELWHESQTDESGPSSVSGSFVAWCFSQQRQLAILWLSMRK